MGHQTQPGGLRQDGTHALETQTDSKFKASLGCLLQSCERNKSTEECQDKVEAQSGKRWRDLEPHRRPWDAARAGPGWKEVTGKQ